MAENQTMAQLLQAPTDGYEDAIVIPEIAATNFELKHGLINLVQNKQFFGQEKEDPHAHLRYFNKITSTMRSKSKVRQTRAKAVVAKVNLNSSTPAVSCDVAELKDMVRALLLDKKNQYSAQTPSPTPAPIKAVEPNCVTSNGSGTLPRNTITNPKEDLKGITTRSGVAYQGPTIPTPSKVAKQGTEKLSKMARTPINEHCSAVILKKLPKKLGDPGKFLIPCEFPGMDECLALADLGTSINLMPLSVWKGLLLPELTPTCMTLKLADRTESKPVGIAKDVKVKVGVFHFPADFVVVDFKPDPRVPLTLRSPTPSDDLIVSTTSPKLTPFGDSDFLLFEEADAFLDLEDYPDSPKLDPSYYDPEVDILLLESILNSDPSPPLPNHEQSVPSFKEELKAYEAKMTKSSIDEPPEVELKDLPSHLEYAFLEGDNKLPVIIAKALKDEEKSALIKVLKSHKRAIAWKLSDIQGINSKFCTHKILMVEDYKSTVQHQRRVNPKIYDVIKKRLKNFWMLDLLTRSLIVHGSARKLNEATRKDHFPLPFMDQMLERLARNEYYCFLDGFSGYFQIPIDPRDQEKTTSHAPTGRSLIVACLSAYAMTGHVSKTLKKKLTEAPILIAPNWDLSFELMCDASDFAIGTVLGKHHEKHFWPIHYASKTLTNAESNYTTTEKEMLAVVYAFKKFRSYLIMNKCIVHTDHSALKYLFAKKDAKARYLRWVLLLQEFDFDVIDTKGAENLAADHLSRLENPYENVLDPKEINENFPLETLSMVTYRGDFGTSWFADFENYRAGNILVKGMSTQQKNKFFKVNGHRIKHYFGGDVPQLVKENQEKDKIRSKPNKNRKCGKARKCQKQLQSIKQEKVKKIQVEGPHLQKSTKLYYKKKKEGLDLQLQESTKRKGKTAIVWKLYEKGPALQLPCNTSGGILVQAEKIRATRTCKDSPNQPQGLNL
nr:reverse transcriptase domain-containing protein, chloroplastic [Tanacetum cinerariifolium]